MADTSLLDRLEGIDARFAEVATLITDPAVIADMKRYVRLNKEYHDLERMCAATRRYRKLLSDVAEAKSLLASENDPDIRQMAHDQLSEAEAALPGLEEEIKIMLIPADPEDAKMPLWKSEVEREVTKPPCLPATFSGCIPNTVSRKDGRWL